MIVGNVYTYHCDSLPNPHNKFGLCVSDRASWVFWFNSNARFHGKGQLRIIKSEHAVCVKDCYLDLSTIQRVSPAELSRAIDNGAISALLRAKIIAALGQKIDTLPETQREAALRNLSAIV